MSYVLQIELNRKRESEIDQIRKEQQAHLDDHEKTVSELRKKHTQAVKELEEQLDTLQKSKTK